MKIKKLGHCCLYIQTEKFNILTDPGNFSTSQNDIVGIDFILITHEHADHLHTDSLKAVLKNNPKAFVITNTSVANILEKENVNYRVVENGQTYSVGGFNLESYDGKHAEIFEEMALVQNTGYFIADRLFYPGDSFINPNRQIDILALPVAGPWCKIADSIKYALELKPKNAFPVHDGMLIKERIGGSHRIPDKVLSEHGIKFISMFEGDELEF